MRNKKVFGFQYNSEITNEEFVDRINDINIKEPEIEVSHFCTCNGKIAKLTVKSSLRKMKISNILAKYFPDYKKKFKKDNCECL